MGSTRVRSNTAVPCGLLRGFMGYTHGIARPTVPYASSFQIRYDLDATCSFQYRGALWGSTGATHSWVDGAPLSPTDGAALGAGNGGVVGWPMWALAPNRPVELRQTLAFLLLTGLVR